MMKAPRRGFEPRTARFEVQILHEVFLHNELLLITAGAQRLARLLPNSFYPKITKWKLLFSARALASPLQPQVGPISFSFYNLRIVNLGTDDRINPSHFPMTI